MEIEKLENKGEIIVKVEHDMQQKKDVNHLLRSITLLWKMALKILEGDKLPLV